LLVLAAVAVGLTLFAAPAAPVPITPVTSAAVSAQVAPAAFDPAATPQANRATVTVVAQAAGTLQVDVVTAGGIVVAPLLAPTAVTAGQTQALKWDGAGVRDGHYVVRARLTDAAGVAHDALTPVTLDSADPVVTAPAPAPAVTAKGPVRVRATADDLSGAVAMRLVVESQLGVEIGRVKMPAPVDGASERVWNLRIKGRLLLPGVYRLRVAVDDAVGRRGLGDPQLLRVERAVASTQIYRLPEAGAKVALTFDDCLDTGPWLQLLAALRRARVKGSFFCNGVNVRANPGAARRTVAEGHTIGSHTWAHTWMTKEAPGEQRSQIAGDREIWWSVAKASPAPFFRPPYGDVDQGARASAGAEGMAWIVLWDVDPSDYLKPAPGVLVDRVVSKARTGSIVVLHVEANTAVAVPGMVRGLRARGLEPVSLDELFGAASSLSRARRG
jgi:peptidoglycan/xylan/chitin deacetylase (PgdA/CDA1 family)